jgi:hypothetical protein
VDGLVAKHGEDNLLAMVRKKFREKEDASEFPVREPRHPCAPAVAGAGVNHRA